MLVRARFSPIALKSCVSAARSFKFLQNLQSHPDYHFIKVVISELLQNQHFYKC